MVELSNFRLNRIKELGDALPEGDEREVDRRGPLPLLPQRGVQELLRLLRQSRVHPERVAHDVMATRAAVNPSHTKPRWVQTGSHRRIPPGEGVSRRGPPIFLVLLMLLSIPATSAATAPWLPASVIDAEGSTTLEGFRLPSNTTIQSGALTVSTQLTPIDRTAHVGIGVPTGFSNGTGEDVAWFRDGGVLTLDSVAAQHQTDFETTVDQFVGWWAGGPDAADWEVSDLTLNGSLNLNGSRILDNGLELPANASAGTNVAATRPGVGPQAGCESSLTRAPFQVPHRFTGPRLSVHHHPGLWSNATDSDAAWVEVSVDDGATWAWIEPEGGYDGPNGSGHDAPFGVNATSWAWSGDIWSGWRTDHFDLSVLPGIIATDAVHVRFQLRCGSGAQRAGWFIDAVNLSSSGDDPGAWFHGSLNGAYADDAEGGLVLPIDLSNGSTPAVLGFEFDFDIEGGTNDNLKVELSLDGGSTYSLLTQAPGLPGLGFHHGPNLYQTTSNGWLPVELPIPNAAVNHTNASSASLRFRVTTDHAIGQGGMINGWEGVMVDEVRVLHGPNRTIGFHENFTTSSSATIQNLSNATNEWQHVTGYGAFGPTHLLDRFDRAVDLPRGWTLHTTSDGDEWRVGTLSPNYSAGPSSWPSGSKGAALGLDRAYRPDAHTHLIGPEIMIPENATARLRFQHWICTEASWDGGAVEVSTDGGATWAHFGDGISGYYDVRSWVNPASPFYGNRIWDGSGPMGGCGGAWGFQPKVGDLSAYGGMLIRPRFTFFSDAFVEGPGWYIDDAGIEVDLFKPSGHWTSPVFEATGPRWGQLSMDGRVPPGTEVRATILADGLPLSGFINRTLPLDLSSLDAMEHDAIRVGLDLSTLDPLITPSIRRLTLGAFVRVDASGVSGDTGLLGAEGLVSNGSGALVLDGTTSTGRIEGHWAAPAPYEDVTVTCGCMQARVFLTADDGTVASATFNSPGNQSLTLPLSQIVDVDVLIFSGGSLSNLSIDPVTLGGALLAEVRVGDALSWGWSGADSMGAFGHQTITSGNASHPVVLLPEGASVQSVLAIVNGTPSTPSMVPNSQVTTFAHPGGYHRLRHHELQVASEGAHIHGISVAWSISQTVTMNATSLTSIQGNITPDASGQVSLPVTVNATQGSLRFHGGIDHAPRLVDAFLTTPESLHPQRAITFTTSHTRLIGGPDIDSVRLEMATTASDHAPMMSVELREVRSTPIVHQSSGSEFVVIDGASTTVRWVSNTTMEVDWVMTPTWGVGDHARLYWFASATGSDGVALGPAMVRSGTTSSSAATNDLELVGAEVLLDGTPIPAPLSSSHPAHLRGSESLDLRGSVRFAGAADALAHRGEASVAVHLTNPMHSGPDPMVLPLDAEGAWSGEVDLGALDLGPGMWWINATLVDIGGAMGAGDSIDATENPSLGSFLIDTESPSLLQVEVIGPSGARPADGRIWYAGDSLPLRITLDEDLGSEDRATVWSWNGAFDDDDQDGRADEGEYHAHVLRFQPASGRLVLDVPLIDIPALPESMDHSLLSFWVEASDRAGNPMTEGGRPGLDTDAATFTLMRRAPTSVDLERLRLDVVNGTLRPGAIHRIGLDILDGNGFASLDSIRFDLDGVNERCTITHHPWNGTTEWDRTCFMEPPVTMLQEVDGIAAFDVEFRLMWNAEPPSERTPRITVFDEGQDIGLGLSSIRTLKWTLDNRIEMRPTDRMGNHLAPAGPDWVLPSTGWSDVGYRFYHEDGETEVIGLGPHGTIERTTWSGTEMLTINGSLAEDRVSIRTTDGELITVVVHIDDMVLHRQEIRLIVDDAAPRLIPSEGIPTRLTRGNLSDIPLDVVVVDDLGLDEEGVTALWSLTDGSSGVLLSTGRLPLTTSSIDTQRWIGTLDLSRFDTSIQDEATLLIWFEGTDRGGRELVGPGVAGYEIRCVILNSEFQPELVGLDVNERFPAVGEVIVVEVEVRNLGLGAGEVQTEVIDVETGRVLAVRQDRIDPGTTVQLTLEVEMWDAGELDLALRLDGGEPIPIPLGEVGLRDGARGVSATSPQVLGVVGLLLVASVLAYRYRSELTQVGDDEYDVFTDEEE